MTTDVSLSGLSTDLKTGLAFLTRLPIPYSAPPSFGEIGRAGWTFPLVGALVGVFAAIVYWLSNTLGLNPFVSALLAVGATLAVTGGLHEDGLADTSDGFGGGETRERKLEIMRDSRTGAFGVSALVLSILLRAGMCRSLAEPALVAPALIAAHAGARAVLPFFMWLVPNARQDGLAASVGQPPTAPVMVALLIGFTALVLCLGLSGALIAVLTMVAVIGILAWLCLGQIGGQTGDVLGALEQVCEILILLVASVWLY